MRKNSNGYSLLVSSWIADILFLIAGGKCPQIGRFKSEYHIYRADLVLNVACRPGDLL